MGYSERERYTTHTQTNKLYTCATTSQSARSVRPPPSTRRHFGFASSSSVTISNMPRELLRRPQSIGNRPFMSLACAACGKTRSSIDTISFPLFDIECRSSQSSLPDPKSGMPRLSCDGPSLAAAMWSGRRPSESAWKKSSNVSHLCKMNHITDFPHVNLPRCLGVLIEQKLDYFPAVEALIIARCMQRVLKNEIAFSQQRRIMLEESHHMHRRTLSTLIVNLFRHPSANLNPPDNTIHSPRYEGSEPYRSNI